MKQTGQSNLKSMGRRFALPLAILFAALTAFPATALADRGERRHRQEHQRYGKAYHNVPRHLHHKNRKHFRSYYAGKFYYRPHRHYHRAYHFPVYVRGVVVHRPYYYCDDRIFLAAAVPLPRLAIGIHFGSPGVVYGPAYYHPPTYPHHHHDDCDHDDYYGDYDD